ncbi:MAG TPA: septal ring lytic transglycosylase RlpA family protein [Terriglobales bacterium]|nr:septal ring lytic transglycosylase RlpA family protein [Terriglobales bacterium]
MRRRIAYGLAALLLAAAGLGAGAAGGPNSSEAGKTQRKLDPTAIPVRHKRGCKPYQVGVASWYGDYFQGKPTASGEPFDMHEFTAAHPTLPLGTFVRVTNLRNGRSVILRINDRGPVVDGRIIDVSYNAAKALDFKSRGLQRVRLDLVPTQTVAMSRPPVLP